MRAIDELVYLLDEAFRGKGIEETNESQSLLANLTTLDEASPGGRARRLGRSTGDRSSCTGHVPLEQPHIEALHIGDADRTSDRDRRRLGEGPDAFGMLRQPLPTRDRQHDERRVQGLDRRLQRVEWGVRSQIRDSPAPSRDQDAESDQPELVLLARWAREDRGRASTRAPTTGQTEHTAAYQVRGEVLLPDRRVSARPSVAELR